MSITVRNSGYFMYGICIPYDFYNRWEENNLNTFDKTFDCVFQNIKSEDVFTPDDNNDYRIHTIFDNRGAKYIIIGRVIEAISKGIYGASIQVPELNEFEIDYIKTLIKKHFDLDGEYHYYYIKN